MYDAVDLISRALHTLDIGQPQRIETQALNCRKANTWPHGPLILEAFRRVSRGTFSLKSVISFLKCYVVRIAIKLLLLWGARISWFEIENFLFLSLPFRRDLTDSRVLFRLTLPPDSGQGCSWTWWNSHIRWFLFYDRRKRDMMVSLPSFLLNWKEGRFKLWWWWSDFLAFPLEKVISTSKVPRKSSIFLHFKDLKTNCTSQRNYCKWMLSPELFGKAEGNLKMNCHFHPIISLAFATIPNKFPSQGPPSNFRIMHILIYTVNSRRD